MYSLNTLETIIDGNYLHVRGILNRNPHTVYFTINTVRYRTELDTPLNYI